MDEIILASHMCNIVKIKSEEQDESTDDEDEKESTGTPNDYNSQI